MFSAYLFKSLRFLPFLAFPVLAWLWPLHSQAPTEDFSPEKVNLALRRTADGLLRASGDSTSRIPAIEQIQSDVWRVQLEQPFSYDLLPSLLQQSLEVHGIIRPYQVAVRRCADEVIELGYHQLDYIQDSTVPCGGRAMPEGCHFIEITFSESNTQSNFWAYTTLFLALILTGLGTFWLFQRKKTTPTAKFSAEEPGLLEFGNFRLDVAGQLLFCKGVRQTLTFRETKLLRLFAENPNRLLERSFILQEVWADEGVLVGRSVDVFVSRLRKKLTVDSSVDLVAVHGVGYRLEAKERG